MNRIKNSVEETKAVLNVIKREKGRVSEAALEIIEKTVSAYVKNADTLTARDVEYVAYAFETHLRLLTGYGFTPAKPLTGSFFDTVQQERAYSKALLRKLQRISEGLGDGSEMLSVFELRVIELAISEATDWLDECVVAPFSSADGDFMLAICVMRKLWAHFTDVSSLKDPFDAFLLYTKEEINYFVESVERTYRFAVMKEDKGDYVIEQMALPLVFTEAAAEAYRLYQEEEERTYAVPASVASVG